MTLCDNKHDEVCYGSRSCPVCELLVQIEDLKIEIKKLEEAE